MMKLLFPKPETSSVVGTILFIILILNSSFVAEEDCVNLDNAKMVNNERSFEIICLCKFEKLRIEIYNPTLKKIGKFETKNEETIYKINQYVNDLANDSLIDSDLYFARLTATNKKDSIIREFYFYIIK